MQSVRHPGAHLRFQIGSLRDQPTNIGAGQGQDIGGSQSPHIGVLDMLGQQSHLPKEISFAQRGKRQPIALNRHLTVHDQVEGLG